MQCLDIGAAQAGREPALRRVEVGMREEFDKVRVKAQDQPPLVPEPGFEPETRIERLGRIEVPAGQVGGDPGFIHPGQLSPAQKSWIRVQASLRFSSEVA